MNEKKIRETIAALNLIKATVKWDYPIEYQNDIDSAIEGLEELYRIKSKKRSKGCHWYLVGDGLDVETECGRKCKLDMYYKICPYCQKNTIIGYKGDM